MIYIDSSCLLKLLLEEPESEAVRHMVAQEEAVVVSPLAVLETAVQLRSGWRGGRFRERRYRAYAGRLRAFRETDPFRFVSLPGTVFQTALRQHGATDQSHCRTLDRLHLAAMEELGVRRLVTNDDLQAAAARRIGFDVFMPGR